MVNAFLYRKAKVYAEDESRVHNVFPRGKLLYVHSDNMDRANDWRNTKEKRTLEETIFTALMVTLGVLTGSAFSLPLGMLGGIVGAVAMAIFFGALSVLFEKRTNGKNHHNNH
jgi:hypothetical protein